ncbi:MAG TPA: hypothetical protein DCY64_05865 [Hydrogenophaga sp.]|uniref:hypothetical protein n=1 Tax=Hydrogenophaga sp. TaxID=1904254 RepID=UPI0008AEF93A|nr:hypothetical protein [Hydrogenophaga sp.]OGA76562.1 MAG: hypothetical protein A2X73_19865 [Burkholderiales bacterium GWE1_65_30]OGA91478.1 MAG: hypothetical protein A2X72_04770 [Burkholderiales bacterium GWF1_66_17]HAX19793.1 hypothetical protein [Hydrogenophaga sp.]HBU20149.1 hypothetical protein [Hydrogenophaga sp.]
MPKIFEPIYQSGQVLTEPLFHPLQISDNRFSAWREFRIYIDMYRSGRHLEKDKVGMFSPKFGLKSKISAQQFLDFCHKHKSADVCFINPFPHIRYRSYNVWMQGEANHPGLTTCAQNLLDACGVSWQLNTVPRQAEDTLAYSNFWVGSEKFWNRYVGQILEPIAQFLESSPEHPAAQAVTRQTFHSDPAPFLPFIIERLFSTFLSFSPDIKAQAYPLKNTLDYCLSEYEKTSLLEIMPTIDAADQAGFFSEELLKTMWELVCDDTKAAKEHFSIHPHPHTGRVIQDNSIPESNPTNSQP